MTGELLAAYGWYFVLLFLVGLFLLLLSGARSDP